MWTREKRPNNMVINDPKGELLVKNYVKGTMRGFQIVQFNLINAMKTDIYNPLILAADAAREGDFTKCAMYVENIAEVFFPLDGGDDPVWPSAANNAFKRAAYGLIDYYLEEEKEMRRQAIIDKTDPKVLEAAIDTLWGKVTLYNCYQLFVQLTSKKLKNPLASWDQQWKAKMASWNKQVEAENEKRKKEGQNPVSVEEMFANDEDFKKAQREYDQALEEAPLYEDKPEMDLLTLFFNASAALPKNGMRTLVDNANQSLRSMAGAEKMLASCGSLHNEKLCCRMVCAAN